MRDGERFPARLWLVLGSSQFLKEMSIRTRRISSSLFSPPVIIYKLMIGQAKRDDNKH